MCGHEKATFRRSSGTRSVSRGCGLAVHWRRARLGVVAAAEVVLVRVHHEAAADDLPRRKGRRRSESSSQRHASECQCVTLSKRTRHPSGRGFEPDFLVRYFTSKGLPLARLAGSSGAGGTENSPLSLMRRSTISPFATPFASGSMFPRSPTWRSSSSGAPWVFPCLRAAGWPRSRRGKHGYSRS